MIEQDGVDLGRVFAAVAAHESARTCMPSASTLPAPPLEKLIIAWHSQATLVCTKLSKDEGELQVLRLSSACP